ncbi:MAG TPA: hypothetical protein VNJ07_02130 [Chitinophagales bacterium]|nr:hypothetical protein [Chitinophagales bacterium]
MRKQLLSISGMLLLCFTMMAQTPAAFKYQAIARSSSGEVMANQTMNVRLGIFKGISMEYSEVHTVTTNEFGLFSVEVGRGSPELGNFFDITWGEAPHFLRVEVDPTQNGHFMYLGMSELLSVPYARHAATVEHNDDADADPENEIQDLKVIGSMLRITRNQNPTVIDLSQFNTDDQQLSYDEDQHIINLENGGSIDLTDLKEDADADPANELQTLSQTGTIVTLSHGGGSVNVADGDDDSVNELQTISQSGNTISLSNGGGSVIIPDDDPENEIQDLVFNNNYLYITNNPNATVIDMNHFMDNTDNQQIAFDSQTGILSLQQGGVVNLSTLEDDADADVTNELQTISRVGDEIVLSHNGGTVNIDDNDSDPANEIQTLSQVGSVVTLSNGGGTITIDDDDSNPFNELQDLMLIGDSLAITNNPFATVIDLNSIDNQTLNFSGATNELTITNGNTVDLSSLEDDADADPLNEIQDLFISGDNLVITNNPFATVIDLSGYMDNTDAQSLSLSGTDLSISGGNTVDMSSFMDDTDTDDQTLSVSGTDLSISEGNTVDLSSFLDNTDAQTLGLAGNTLSISGGNSVDLSAYLDADNLGNHTATQNIKIGTHYVSNDGDSEGIRITTTGNVTASSDFFVGENATTNSDLYISGRMYDWDNSSYYVDPNFQSRLTDLRVDAGVIVNTGGLTVSAGGAAITGNSSVTGTFSVSGAAALANTLSVTGAATFGSTIDVTSDATFNSNILVSGNADVIGVLDVTGNTFMSSNLDVSGDIFASDDVSIADQLTVAGTSFVDGPVIFSGTVNAASQTITSDYTAGNNFIILVDAASGNVTVNLPAVASSNGRIYIIKRLDGSMNSVTIDPNGAEQVDGAATASLAAQYDFVKVFCDGTQWLVIGQ